jgi:hypothetical protein
MKSLLGCVGVSLLALAGCTQQAGKEYSCYANGVVSAHPKWREQFEEAAVEVHRRMAEWMVDGHGTKIDPTYIGGTETWDRLGKNRCDVSHVQFRNEDGDLNRLETVCIPSKGILVTTCTSEDDAAGDALLEEFVDVLDSEGFTCSNVQ